MTLSKSTVQPRGGSVGYSFDLKLQLSQRRYVTTSHAAATSLVEDYVGLETV